MGKKHLVGFAVLLVALIWWVVRIGENDSEKSTSQKKSPGNGEARSSSQQQGVRSSSRGGTKSEKIELSSVDQAIYRAQGFLKPDQVDLRVHTKVGENQYTKRITVDEKLIQKILSEVGKHDQISLDQEKLERSMLEGVITELGEGSRTKKSYMGTLEMILGENNKPYKELDKAVIAIAKYDDPERRREVAKAWSLKIPLKKNHVARITTVKEAHKRCVAKSPISRYFPRYLETETHYIFFLWDTNLGGSYIRKSDHLINNWWIGDQQ